MEKQDIMRQTSLLGPAIASKISMFAKRASVVDAKFREDVLMRVGSIHDMFVSLFSDEYADDSASTSEDQPLKEAISGMLRFLSVAHSLVLHIRFLSNVHVQDAYVSCRQVFSRQRSSIFYVLQRNLVTPILNAQDSLFGVMDDLVNKTDDDNLRKFQSILAWAAAAWEGMLSVSEKTTLNTDSPIIDYEYILRLEHDLTLNRLCRHIETPLDNLLQACSEAAEMEEAGNADESDERHQAQQLILGKMSDVASIFENNKGWNQAQNAEQLIVVKEIQHMLCLWNGLDGSARSDLAGPAEDLEHATETCPFVAGLQGASPGVLNSALFQIPLYLAAYGGGKQPFSLLSKGSTAEIFHVRVTSTPKNVVVYPGQVRIMFLFDHRAKAPLTAALLHCTEDANKPIRSILHITWGRGCERQNQFVRELLEHFSQELGYSNVATDSHLLDEPRNTGADGVNENVFGVLCALAACRLDDGHNLQEIDSSAGCRLFVDESVRGDVMVLREEIEKRLRIVRNLPERNSLTTKGGTLHDVMDIFQSVFDAVNQGLRDTPGPSGPHGMVLRRLQVHLKQQSSESRRAELHRRAERAVPKSPFERAKLVDFLESKTEAFPNISKPMLALINREPCAQAIVNRSRCAVKLLKNVQRLLTFVAKFQRMNANDSSSRTIGDMHRTLLPLVYRFKNTIVSPVIRAVVNEDDNVVISRELDQEYFTEKQEQLTNLLREIGVPPATIEKFRLSTILVEPTESLPAATGHGGASMQIERALAQGISAGVVGKLISCLQQAMETARNMASPPRHLIAALNKHLQELVAYQESDRVSDDEIKMRQVAIDKLCSKLVEHGATLDAEDPVLSKLPKELLELNNLCRKIPHDVREITGKTKEAKAPTDEEALSASSDARVALEMVAERNGILKLIDLLPTTRDADARRALQRQAVTLMLPAVGSQDVEPQVLRRDALLASAAKRARSLLDKPAASLLGSMSVLEENFQIRPEDGNPTDILQRAPLSDVVGMVSSLHVKRLNVLNVVNSFDAETLLRVCPVSLSISDIFGLTAIACPDIIDYCVTLQAAADSALKSSFGHGGEGESAVDLPELPRQLRGELTDARPELLHRPDLCPVSLIDSENVARIFKPLVTAMSTIRKVLQEVLGGDVASDCHSPKDGNTVPFEMPVQNTRLRPAGIVSATDEWIPLQTFFCLILVELCGSIAKESMTREDLTGMLEKHMAKDRKLTADVKEQERLVEDYGDDLRRKKDELDILKRQLHGGNRRSASSSPETGTAKLRSRIKATQEAADILDKKIQTAQCNLSQKERELERCFQGQVRKQAQDLHESIKAIFSDRPFGSNSNTPLSAEAVYEHIVTIPSQRRGIFLNSLSKATGASLQKIARVRDMLHGCKIDRNVAVNDLCSSRLLHLLDVCKLAMYGMNNTAGCLQRYLDTVETSGELLCDFVAEPAPRLEQVFSEVEMVFDEAQKDCSSFDILEEHSIVILESLERLRDDEEGFSYHHGDSSLARSAAIRSWPKRTLRTPGSCRRTITKASCISGSSASMRRRTWPCYFRWPRAARIRISSPCRSSGAISTVIAGSRCTTAISCQTRRAA